MPVSPKELGQPGVIVFSHFHVALKGHSHSKMEENQHLLQHFRPKPKSLFIRKLLLALAVFIVLILIEIEGLMQLCFPSLTSMNCSWAQTRNRAGALLYVFFFFYPILRTCKFSPECLPRALFKVHGKTGVGGAGGWIMAGSPHSSAGLTARKNHFSFANESRNGQKWGEGETMVSFLQRDCMERMWPIPMHCVVRERAEPGDELPSITP